MSELTCGSLFSGVGGMDIGLKWAGFRHLFFAEVDAYARAVLAARFPGVPIYEDVRDVARDDDGHGHVDLLCGGFPCQDLSVAGKRAGLAGERSGLFWEAMRIADAFRPRAVLLENVEGLYSSNGGRDFGVVLNALAERGYLVSWRTLDAQHFGVPQRRRRVFVCAIADGDPAAERIGEVLALAEGGGRNSPTSDPSWPLPSAGAQNGAEGSGRVVGALAGRSMSRLDEQCVGGGQLVASSELSQRPTGSSPAKTWDRAEPVLSCRPTSRERERERERASRECDHGDYPARSRRLNGAGRPSDRGNQWRAIGVNPSNDDIAGTLPSNAQGGQRTTDIAGAYVVRERERATRVPQVSEGEKRD